MPSVYIVCVHVAIFRLVADSNQLVSEHQLNLLLRECIQIPRHLGEIAAFGGSSVEPSVRSCFEKVSYDLFTVSLLTYPANFGNY